MPTVLTRRAYDRVSFKLEAFVVAATTSAQSLAPDIRAFGTLMQQH
jgi:hypothetical protein